MKELNGINARKTRFARAFECAGRWLIEQDKPCTAQNIFENMTYKNGNLYRNKRGTIHFHSFLAKLCRNKMFKKYKEHPNGSYLFTCTQRDYDKHFADYNNGRGKIE